MAVAAIVDILRVYHLETGLLKQSTRIERRIGRQTQIRYKFQIRRMRVAAAFNIGEDSQVALSDRRGKLDLEVDAEAFTAKVFDEE